MEIERATVHEEHLEKAKKNLKESLKRLCDANKRCPEMYKQLLRLVTHFEDLKLSARITPEHIRLDIGLKGANEEGALLDLGQEQAIYLMIATDPQEYLALCEEALITTIALFEKTQNFFDTKFTPEIQKLLRKLGDIQTAQGITADRNLMYINFNERKLR